MTNKDSPPQREDPYLLNVSLAVNRYIYSNPSASSFLEFLINTDPGVRKAAGSATIFRSKAILGLKTTSGQNALRTINSAIMLEAESSLQAQQTTLSKTTTKQATATLRKVDDIKQTLENKILEVKGDIKLYIQNGDDQLLDALSDLFNAVQAIAEYQPGQFEGLFERLTELKDLLNQVLNKAESIKDDTANIVTSVNAMLILIEQLIADLGDLTPLIASTADFAEHYYENYNPTFAAITSDAAAAAGSAGTAVVGIASLATDNSTVIMPGVGAILSLLFGETIDPRNITPNLTNFKAQIDAAISEWYEANKSDFVRDDESIKKLISDWYDESKDSIHKESTDFICERIVGESYIKFDGENTFWPTLVLRFKTFDPSEERNYAQLKMRLDIQPDRFTIEDKEALITKLKLLNRFTYTSGGLKCHYVAPLKKFKTTVFVASKKDCLAFFSSFIPLSGTEFVPGNVSYTEVANRDSPSRRTIPLSGETLNPKTIRPEIEMVLSSAYLQINGFAKQIKIY